MPLLSRVGAGIVALLRRTRQEQELDAELQQFLEMAIEDKVRVGMSREAATRAARMELGSTAALKQGVRDVGWETMLDTAWQDLRYAVRTLRRSPGFTTVVVLSLALGMGANTAIFSLVDTLMLRPLPVSHPEQLVQVLSRYPGEPRLSSFSWRHYEHFRDDNRSFSELLAVSRVRLRVTGDGVEREAVDGEYVAGNFFRMLGVRAALGRVVDDQDDRLQSPTAASAVVSWSYWTNRLHADPAVVGKAILVNSTPATIIGVAPREFFGLEVGLRPSMWLPAAMEPLLQRPSRRVDGSLGVGILGRLRPGVSIDQALAEMKVLDRFRLEDFARSRSAAFARDFTIELEPAAAGFATLRDRFGTALLVLMALVGVLLLIACTNVAGLLLARAATRQHEVALRVSLGAGRARLARQVLTESLLLAGMGSVLGVALASAGARALVAIILSGRDFARLQQPIQIHVQPDLRMLLFTATTAVLTALLFGAVPAWRALTAAPAASLRAHGAAGETRSRRLFGKMLVVGQIACSLVLLSAAGLFVQQLSNLRNQKFGFQRQSLLLVTLDATGSGYRGDQLFVPYQQLLDRLAQIPAVRAVTISAVTPISGAGASRFISVAGFPESPDARRFVPLNWVGPRYFETFGTPLLAGRDFAFTDRGGPPVAIVNQSLARYYFGGRDPIGGRFQFVGASGSGVTNAPPDQTYTIVGIVADAKYLDLREAPPRTIYLNAFQEPRMFVNEVALKTAGHPAAATDAVRQAVRDELKTVSIARVTTMDDVVDGWVVSERVVATLSSFFGGLGATLAALGLYGLLAFTVTRRTTEIGTRMALGASRADILRVVLNGALGLVCAGVAIGVPLGLVSRRAASRLVTELPVNDLRPLVFAIAAMFALALLAAYVPARRAARVDPVDALRQ
ncbi:MAG TPA: ABC transporter permease [Vicinamibacterales bacterium]|jgi:predicted permease|nr:ABC transporter permease [Vicinamibacterales bacterium]